ncbi:peptidase G2 autoproteolytic cleavage domain-containing protein [Cytobacillus purgationiresistens]|uniref:Peptidase G2 IMC autoproteolytic cleavage domain-containing protein n=1 Tax=Cytobacillus purgationiresistens TaxID=863449 RepID=A0ABU0AN99_9BACI|nr:peptidase G2 autoproteolytic cleavage domain-containing protein [Cytobacillus purgationiresistens]MDQ0272329.1 hypothetical protein [Cytobacillus purgationiresistens]
MTTDSAELDWNQKFKTDKWGRIQYQKMSINRNDNKLSSIMTDTPILNTDFELSQNYIPQRNRPEWVTVGDVGKLLVSDDGPCKVNIYCMPKDEGVTTASDIGYLVINRLDCDQILIMMK